MARFPKIPAHLIAKPSPKRDARDLRKCLQGGVHRMRGSRHENGAALLKRAISRDVGRALSKAGEVWWGREEARRAEANRAPELTLEQRRDRMIVGRYIDEIKRRGGEVWIDGKYGSVGLALADRGQGLYLLRAEGWREYGRSKARIATLAYLCGHDDNGMFATRVPGTCKQVEDALDALTPAEVRKARAEGRTVLRQGDVWIVQRKPSARAKDDFRALPESHRWDDRRRTLRHLDSKGRSHRPVKVPFPAVAVPQSTVRMGRGGGIGRAD